jgi:hypothetical protein
MFLCGHAGNDGRALSGSAVCPVWRGMLRDSFAAVASLSIHPTLSPFFSHLVIGASFSLVAVPPLSSYVDCYMRNSWVEMRSQAIVLIRLSRSGFIIEYFA